MATRTISKTFCLAASVAFAALLVSTSADAQRGGARAGGSGARAGGASVSHQTRATAGGSVNSANRAQTANRGQNTNQSINNSGNRNNVNTGNRNNINTGNINTGDVNINRDVNVDVDNGWHGDWDYNHYHPVATAAVVTAAVATTAWVMGSYYRSLPPNCATIYRGTVVYYQCGTYWYQPVYSGSSVQYVAIAAP
jgi:hypothetical protein